ncbi:MAG TPA: S53 family peptidase [Anaerolineales bacterium]|nr:S53 family peptidase [Anaerolineales bacterium]
MKQKIFTILVILTIVAMLPGSALAAQSTRTTLHGSAPAWANSKNYAGAADASAYIGFRVYLGWQNASAAEALARAVSDPNSAQYRQYLTPQQFRRQFAPSQAQVGAVQSWLKSQGFSVNHTPMNNHYVSAEGTIAQAQTAFGVQFGMYKVNGKTVRSPSGDVSIPNSLAATVSGVIGLDESAIFVETDHIKDAPPSGGFRNAPPLSSYWAELVSPYAYPAGFTDLTNPATAPWAIRGHTPDQIKSAYGIPNTYDGAGQTVAIIDAYASPTILQDVNQWSTNRGLPTMSPSQFVQVVPPGVYRRPQNKQQDPQGWYGEETLDVEAVHGMAPAAKIVYVGAPNNYQDLDAAMNHVVDQHLAQIVTNSYGFPTTELLPPGYVKPFEDTLIQAAAEGIGVYFSSGDSGDETSRFGFATADWPASSPWVTAVGGTSLGVDQSGARAIETGWGTSSYSCNATTLVCTRSGWLYGSGGGESVVFAAPDYQAALGKDGRAVPDVAALGDPQTGLLVGQTQTFPDGVYYDEYRIGGTSLSSPIFAGLMALLDQKSGSPHGFANPLFYDNPGAFYDVLSVKTAVARRNFKNSVDASAGTSDFLRTFDDYSGSPTQSTGPGWDNVTGLGVPNSGFWSLP